MCPLQNKTRSDSSSNSIGEDRNSFTTSEIALKKIITLANEHVSLLSVLERNNVKLEQDINSKRGWSHKAICPFKSHKNGRERTPSFGYNSKEDRFNCFGCRKFGRSVEFLSILNNLNHLDAARELLSEAGIDPSDARILIDTSNDKINNLLFDFSKYLFDLLSLNKNNIKYMEYIDKIIYCFDMYFNYITSKGILDINQFTQRINEYKFRLSKFEINK